MIGILFDKSNGSCTDCFILPSFVIIDLKEEGEQTTGIISIGEDFYEGRQRHPFLGFGLGMTDEAGRFYEPPQRRACPAETEKRYSGRPGRPLKKKTLL